MLQYLNDAAEHRGVHSLIIAASADLRQYVREYIDLLDPERRNISHLEANISEEDQLLERLQEFLSVRQTDPMSSYNDLHPDLKTDTIEATLDTLIQGNVERVILDATSSTLQSSQGLSEYKSSLIPEHRSLESHIAMMTIDQGGEVLVSHQETDDTTTVWTVKRFVTNENIV